MTVHDLAQHQKDKVNRKLGIDHPVWGTVMVVAAGVAGGNPLMGVVSPTIHLFSKTIHREVRP
jgi:hypothetical protein